VTDVGFGGTNAADLSVHSDTEVTATTPDGTGTVDVVLIGSWGSSTPAPVAQFTFV